MDEAEFLEKYSDWIIDGTMISWLVRHVSAGWVKLMYKLGAGMEGIVDEVFKVFDFLNHGIIGQIYDGMRWISLILLVVSIIILSYKYIINDKVDLKSGIARGFIFVLLAIQLPGLINLSVDLSTQIYADGKSVATDEEASLSYNVISQNLVDLQYVSQRGFHILDNVSENQTNSLSEKAFVVTDLTEILEPKHVRNMAKSDANPADADETKMLQYELAPNSAGEIEADKISNGWNPFSFDEGKFRFSFNAGVITITMITISFAFVCSAFVIGSSVLELVFAKLMFPILSATDIDTGQRTKKILLDIGSSFLTIMLSGFCLSIFNLYLSYVSTLDINFFAYLILCIVGIKIAIDGPNFFGKYLGVDVGVRSGWQAMLGVGAGAAMLGKGIAAGGKGIAAGGKGIGNATDWVKNKFSGNGEGGGDSAIPKSNNQTKSIRSASGTQGNAATDLSDYRNANGGASSDDKKKVDKSTQNSDPKWSENYQADSDTKDESIKGVTGQDQQELNDSLQTQTSESSWNSQYNATDSSSTPSISEKPSVTDEDQTINNDLLQTANFTETDSNWRVEDSKSVVPTKTSSGSSGSMKTTAADQSKSTSESNGVVKTTTAANQSKSSSGSNGSAKTETQPSMTQTSSQAIKQESKSLRTDQSAKGTTNSISDSIPSVSTQSQNYDMANSSTGMTDTKSVDQNANRATEQIKDISYDLGNQESKWHTDYHHGLDASVPHKTGHYVVEDPKAVSVPENLSSIDTTTTVAATINSESPNTKTEETNKYLNKTPSSYSVGLNMNVNDYI